MARAIVNTFSNRNKENLLINGKFDFWQRGVSLSAGTGTRYLADRFKTVSTGTTAAISRQTFTLGQTDVPSNPVYFHRTVVASSVGAANRCVTMQVIEGLEKTAGKTITMDFWVKADAVRSIAVEMTQEFGTGGSPSATVLGISPGKYSVGTSWTRITHTFVVPSIGGKTIGTDGNDSTPIIIWYDGGTDFNSRNGSLGHQSGTFDIANLQIIEGEITNSEFRYASTNKHDEFLLCQRYYEKSYNIDIFPGAINNIGTSGGYISRLSTGGLLTTKFSVQKRANPVVTVYSPINGAANSIAVFPSTTIAIASVQAGATSFNVISADTAGVNSLGWQWAAEAEL